MGIGGEKWGACTSFCLGICPFIPLNFNMSRDPVDLDPAWRDGLTAGGAFGPGIRSILKGLEGETLFEAFLNPF